LKILIFTSGRSDSGIFSPIVEALSSRSVEIHCIASGSHIVDEFGHTLEEELKDWKSAKIHVVPLSQYGNSSVNQSLALGKLQIELTKKIAEISPDLALVLGDRAEAFVFAGTCSVMGTPLAHFHGGEVTGGALDELHRHAISKLSALHFVNSQSAASRLRSMGEDPKKIFYFGSLIRDRIKNLKPASKTDLAKRFNFEWGERTALVTIHGARFDYPSTEVHLSALLSALDAFKDLNVIFTGPNSDPESTGVRRMILEACRLTPDRFYFVESFGSEAYLQMLAGCDVAIGNSSSLILEAPHVGVPTIILGSRQRGRGPEKTEIGANEISLRIAIEQSLCSPRSQASNGNYEGDQTISQRVADVIISHENISQQKIFMDT
jgi:UDP-hydrolysing UDP-N-acetyl-D-glucosamine 2-epimerase